MSVTGHTPRVSVCMPVRNQTRYVRNAVTSVLRQSFEDFELIVFDDASTDDTQAVVRSFRDPRLRYIRQLRRVGIARNRNSCLAVARGEYVAWLDGDDEYGSGMLATQAAVLDRHPRVGLVHGGHRVIDREGRRLPDWPAVFADDVIEPGRDAFGELVLSNYVVAPTVLVRRECYGRVGGYSVELSRSGEDWELWMRIALRFDIAYTAAPVASYRVHETSSSAATAQSGERLRLDEAAVGRILRRERNLVPELRRTRRRARAALAFKALVHAGNAFTAGDRRSALAACLRAFRLAPALARTPDAPRLVVAIARGSEYENYRSSKALLRALHVELDGSRFAERVRKLAIVDAEWEATVRAAADRVRSCVPRRAAIAVADKYDPTLLHLCGRRGWHYPDRRLLPGGYPRDSEEAILHLCALQALGAEYLVLPRHSLWWLEHYAGLADHLERDCERAWSDERCTIFRLAAVGEAAA